MDPRIFEGLSREKIPPESLEASVIDRLKKEGLIKKRNAMKNYLKWAAVIVAIVGAYFPWKLQP